MKKPTFAKGIKLIFTTPYGGISVFSELHPGLQQEILNNVKNGMKKRDACDRYGISIQSLSTKIASLNRVKNG